MISIEQSDIKQPSHFFCHSKFYPDSLKVNGDVFHSNTFFVPHVNEKNYYNIVNVENGLVEEQCLTIQTNFSLYPYKQMIDTQAAQCRIKLSTKAFDNKSIDKSQPTQMFDFLKNCPYDRKELKATIHNYRTNICAIKRKIKNETIRPSQISYYNGQIESKKRKLEFFKTMLKQLSKD